MCIVNISIVSLISKILENGNMEWFYIGIALLVSFLWGITPLVHKQLLNDIRTETILFLGGVLYFAALLAFSLYHRGIISKDIPKIDARHGAWLFIASVLAGFVTNMLYLYVLKKHSSYIISALIYSAPVFTMLIAWLGGLEVITGFGLLGTVLIILGVICISFSDNAYKLEDFLMIR